MMRHNPEYMTEREVAEKWADYLDMHEDISERLGLPERPATPIPKDEMVDRNMVFIGSIPVIEAETIEIEPEQ